MANNQEADGSGIPDTAPLVLQDQPDPLRKCGNCDHFYRIQGAPPSSGLCRFNPPVVNYVMQTTPNQTDDGRVMKPGQRAQSVNVQQVPTSTFPATHEEQRCGSHRFADEPTDVDVVVMTLDTLTRHVDRIARFIRDGLLRK